MSQMIFHIYFVVLTSFLFKSFKSFVVCVCCLGLHRLGSALQDDDEVVVSITKEDPLGGPRSDRDVTLQVDDARLDSWNAEVFRPVFNDSFAIFNMESPLHLKTKFTFLSFPVMNSPDSKCLGSTENPKMCAISKDDVLTFKARSP